MIEMMTFPDTWEEFEKSYGFTDNEEVYTNGARLIPSFRVKQWLDHLPSVQQEQLDCEDCIKHGGDWECDRVHCHKGDDPDTNVGELISRQAAIAEFSCCELTPDGGIDANYAIDFLKQLPSVQPETNCSEIPNNSDLIERQAAIDAVKEYFKFSPLEGRQCAKAIERVPSTQPDKDLIHLQKEQAYMQGYEDGKKSRKGKWLIYLTFDDCYYAKCNQCHESQVFYYNKPLTNFCPNCGADMRAGDAE